MSEKQSVLIICRSAAGQMYLGVLLNRIWYSPVLAKTVEEATLFAQTTPFSLVLFDGDVAPDQIRHTISVVKNEPSLQNLPLIVFMTDHSQAENDALFAQGCSAVVTKPIDLTLLYGLLQKLCGQPRSTPRVPVKIAVDIREEIPEKTLTTVNISEGGMYLRTAAPLQEGTILHVGFSLPHDPERIELKAAVVRTLPLGPQLRTDPGMGLHFLDPPESVMQKIRNFAQWEMTGDLDWKPEL